MNKNVSLAIKKAVGSLGRINQNGLDQKVSHKPDLFSLTGETELFQNDKGITIKIDRARDGNLTDFGRATLLDRYLGQNESFQDLFARVASTYADDNLHAQRLYNYISKLWFMPATPVLSNGGTERGLPISCFLNEAGDSLEGILGLPVFSNSPERGVGLTYFTGPTMGYLIGFLSACTLSSFVKISDNYLIISIK